VTINQPEVKKINKKRTLTKSVLIDMRSC